MNGRTDPAATAATATQTRQASLRQHPADHVVVHAQLPGDGASAPSLDMVIAQDLCLAVRRNDHDALIDRGERRLGAAHGDAGTPATNGAAAAAPMQCHAVATYRRRCLAHVAAEAASKSFDRQREP